MVVAGGIFDRKDIDHAMALGADGVQIASRFVATKDAMPMKGITGVCKCKERGVQITRAL